MYLPDCVHRKSYLEPGATGICCWASEFFSYLAQLASEVLFAVGEFKLQLHTVRQILKV